MNTISAGASIRLVKRLSDRMLRPLYALRAELGLPRGPHPLIEGIHAPSAALALFSKLLVRDQRDWPRQLRVTGFPYHDLRGRPGDPVGLRQIGQQLAANASPTLCPTSKNSDQSAREFQPK